jgi:hypothetical protein
MVIAQRLDEFGKPAWLVVMVVGFILWWPIGLAVLGYMIWSGRMGCGRGNWGRWKSEKLSRFGSHRGYHPGGGHSGNSAFEDYKTETLRRLEDEQQEFVDFLKRLREAKDKAEFDQFMQDRRNRPQTPAPDMPQEGSPA